MAYVSLTIRRRIEIDPFILKLYFNLIQGIISKKHLDYKTNHAFLNEINHLDFNKKKQNNKRHFRCMACTIHGSINVSQKDLLLLILDVLEF